MNNISVIIPTMWIPETFEEQLNDLVHFVDDIIIINNNVKITPTWDILKNQTIRVFDQPENIYVNPAWNLGVEQAKNDTLCLLNDDILFNYYILDRVEDFKHIAPDYGIIGLHMMSEFNSSVSLIPSDVRCWGFGCMMFLDKSSYHVIPEELKILLTEEEFLRAITSLGYDLEGYTIGYSQIDLPFKLKKTFTPITTVSSGTISVVW